MTSVRPENALDVRIPRYSYRGSGREVPVLRDISLRIPTGELAAVIGPSGCGKTTLLKLIAGLIEAPDDADVHLWTPRMSEASPALGFAFQAASLLPWRTVAENVRLPLELLGRPDDGRRVFTAIETVGLVGFEGHYPHQLSGGMLARVNVARAIVSDPVLLLLDEPFAHLDEMTRRRLGAELKRIVRHAEATTILVTHNLSDAAALADRLILLSARPASIIRDFVIPPDADITRRSEIAAEVTQIYEKIV